MPMGRYYSNYRLVKDAHKKRSSFKYIYGAFERSKEGKALALKWKSIIEDKDKTLKLAIV
jgi:hypothetical protein